MELSFYSLTSRGPVRTQNEDCVGFWQPEDKEERQQRGAIAVMADGVGGHGHGEVASRLAVDTALAMFRQAGLDVPAKQLLKEIFAAANLALYDAGTANGRSMRMATTLAVCLFRGKEAYIGHVGDSRVYLVRQETIRRLTNDHSYSGLQIKLRLISEQEARASDYRTTLTRSLGPEPIVRPDLYRLALQPHDRLVQCTDGLYCFINDGEIISEGVDRLPVHEICPYLVSLAERRHTDDNLSVQVIQVDRLDEPKYYRPLSFLANGQPAAPSVNHEVQPGQTLDGRFAIERIVSRSGMASIFQAKDLQTGLTVAVKVPHMQFESDAAFFARFEREAEIGQKLNHPNILKIYRVPEQSRPYIVMEYLEGRTLAEIMSEVRPMPLADALQIASRICDALVHMHENKIIHRDLKPQNIMICNDGSLRIMDFGIAKSAEMRRITFVGFSPPMGTPDYMSPEQVKGRRGDERSDIYALGAMLYEMTTGSVPFEGPNPFIVMNSRITGDPIAPRKRNPEITPQVQEIILHALERRPHDRFHSAAEFKAALDNPAEVKVTARHRYLKRPKMWKTRWRGVRVVVLSAIIPVIMFLLMFALTRCHPPHH